MKRPSFAEVKAASLRAIDSVLAHWLPTGKWVDAGHEYTAPNPTRADKKAGSFKINRHKGSWSDFATGDKGGDLIDLVAYVEHCSIEQACTCLAEFLSLETSQPHTPSAAKKADPLDSWSPVIPIPDFDTTVQQCPSRHLQHGQPSKMWIYRNAQGQPLMVLYRFDLADGKAFAPLTWCQSSQGKKSQWRWKGLPEPRPLLNLDLIANQANAVVVLCEGEKAADAAQELFPEAVATCWPNGSKSWAKADFSPLQGREVWLWPDNDASGQSCMGQIALQLEPLGAKVHQIAMAPFEHDSPWPEGADAADALAQGWTAERLSPLIQNGALFQVTPAPTQPEPQATANPTTKPSKASQPKAKAPRAKKPESLPNGFRVTDEGVFRLNEEGEPIPVCSKLEILARTRDHKGGNWGVLVEFDDPDGTRKRLNIPASAMAGEFGKEVVVPLVNMGLRLAPSRTGRNARNDLQSYLQSYDSAERARLVTRLGWHEQAYLLPDQVFGQAGEHLHFYEAGSALPPFDQAGSLEDWQQQVGALCVGNHRLTFAVSLAFAGPLLHLVGAESGGFHFYGNSSTGKSTAGRVACSVYGPPAFEKSWRSTDNALESIAAAHSDGLLVLDEIGQCDPRIIGETVYMLGNGIGKARANDRGQSGKPTQEWRLLFLSSGEKTLAQHMAEASRELKAGMDVRLLAIPADAQKGHGLFDTLHSFTDGAALADALKARVARYYGTPLMAFLSALCDPLKREEYLGLIRNSVEHFIRHTLPANASGQAQRAAARFGLVYAAGELATHLGVTGWPAGTAAQAAQVCFSAWLADRGGAGSQEAEAIINRLRLVVERSGESRFTRWEQEIPKTDDHAPRTVDRLGFRRTVEHGMGSDRYTKVTYYFLPTAWKDEVFRGMSIKEVNRVLVERHILEPSSDGKASQAIRLPGMPKVRTYVINADALLGETQELGGYQV